MPDANIHVEGRREPLVVRINGANPTFRLRTDRVRAAAMAELDPRLLDLLDIAATVFSADGSIKRGGGTRPRMGSGWRRRFEITMGVRRPRLWNSPEVASALTEAGEFLTEDTFVFRFRQAEAGAARQPFLDLDPSGATFSAEDVILFSGGLDSFSGALEVLSSGTGNVILVTHRSAAKAIPRQVELGTFLAERFPGRVLHIHVHARRVGEEAVDNTQRSRSFLFAALGQLVAHAFGAKRIRFFENGVISHNLPLTPQIVGSMATRTTHPLSMLKLNQLMRLVGPDARQIDNSYQWLTKTEVVRRISENGGAGMIPRAVSCTSIREQTILHTHCGSCSQCMDRRFAILAAGLDAHDFAVDYRTDVLFGARESVESRTMALEWTRHFLRLGGMDESRFLEVFGLELARIVRGHPDTAPATVLAQSFDMHRRQSGVVQAVLERAVRENADALVNQQLPATSLLAMLVGQTSANDLRLPEDPRTTVPRRRPVPDVEEVDTVPDRNAPLRVEFLQEGARHIVSVRGLGRVVGKPALIPHALRPVYDEDRRDGLIPEKHRYVPATSLPLLTDMSKEAVRANVKRCRKILAEYFRDLHGDGPTAPLLIQSRSPRGYRLDPLIDVIDSNHEG